MGYLSFSGGAATMERAISVARKEEINKRRPLIRRKKVHML